MDIARPDLKRKKRRKQIAYAVVGLLAMALVTTGLRNLEPAAPDEEKGSPCSRLGKPKRTRKNWPSSTKLNKNGCGSAPRARRRKWPFNQRKLPNSALNWN